MTNKMKFNKTVEANMQVLMIKDSKFYEILSNFLEFKGQMIWSEHYSKDG